MFMFPFENIGRLRSRNMQMLVDKIGTFVFRYGNKCVTGKSIIFQIYEGRGTKPKHGLPTFCFGDFDVHLKSSPFWV